jgi:hypothetical protein
MKRKIFLAAILTLGFLSSRAQGFQPPSPGKAVIYFARVTAAGFAYKQLSPEMAVPLSL